MFDKQWLKGKGITTLASVADGVGMKVVAARCNNKSQLMLLTQNDNKYLLVVYAYRDETHVNQNPLLTPTDLKVLGIVDAEEHRQLLRQVVADTDLSM